VKDDGIGLFVAARPFVRTEANSIYQVNAPHGKPLRLGRTSNFEMTGSEGSEETPNC